MKRPLNGKRVGLSVSDAPAGDLIARGYTEELINEVSNLFVNRLLDLGAGVVLGHDWREDGIMNAIYRQAVRVDSPYQNRGRGAPLIENFVPWPREPHLSDAEKGWNRNLLSAEQFRPSSNGEYKNIDALLRQAQTQRAKAEQIRSDLKNTGCSKEEIENECYQQVPEYALYSAITLTEMRKTLAKNTEARICLGGQTTGYSGLVPGVLEEAYYSAKKQEDYSLYFCGVAGGLTSIMGQGLSTDKENLFLSNANRVCEDRASFVEETQRKYEINYTQMLPPLETMFAFVKEYSESKMNLEIFNAQTPEEALSRITSDLRQKNSGTP